ncbi:MAG TPA: hypothetical protein PLJ27_13605 [Polyangiaceae bacterium]|jgi:hypothetical protein|nr:MAG: hypothetical protein BWY17_02184 [Deltaproteobacteria bacterium ADurb.Bin207]HNS96326.1 hypothetical protein [Polyangiaceae bacterium]HNZ22058.1 hypothetical protein [Polyangiaceae bacterium]HOD22186.1 hypothetical protein [Polyangiaceae bacterium]HOE47366.1 hypothetical protein [Polyangiaceae bacterium]
MFRFRSWFPILVLCLTSLVTFGCDGCKKADNKPQVIHELPEVPAPAHHLADLFVPKPEETYSAFRTHIGGPLALLPSTFPSMVVTSLGLTTQLLEQIDGKSPMVGVMTDDGSRLVVVVGIHVRDGNRTIQLMTEGADAKYSAKPAERGVIVLEPKPTLTSRVATLGVAGHYLMTAEKAQDLVECGPYVSGTLSKRTGIEGQIVVETHQDALKGPLAKRMREAWASFKAAREKEDDKLRKERGRSPDFGEPAAALADVGDKVETIVSVLSDLKRAQLRIDSDAVGIHALLTMVPASIEGVAAKEFSSLVVGDLAPLLAMPQDTVVGLLVRDDEASRELGAKKHAEGIEKLLGERIKEPENNKVKEAMLQWSKGRGDYLAASLRWTRDEQEAIARGAVRDRAEFERGIRSVLGLLAIPAIREPVEHHLGKLTLSNVQKVGPGFAMHVDRNKKVPEGQPAQSTSFDVAWRVDDSTFEARVKPDGKAWLTKDEEKRPSLADHPTTSKIFAGLGADASFVLFFDPQLFLSTLVPPSMKAKETNAPFVIAYGGANQQGWFKLALSHASARELIKMLGRQELK